MHIAAESADEQISVHSSGEVRRVVLRDACRRTIDRRDGAIGAGRAGMAAKSLLRRRQLCRAPIKPFQCAIARSTGASARALRIEPAMMMPAVLDVDDEIAKNSAKDTKAASPNLRLSATG